jgi:hypothetical protein
MTGSAPALLETPHRIGVIIVDENRLRANAIKYLILRLNTLQRDLEFEFQPVDENDPFIRSLRSTTPLDHSKVTVASETFPQRHRTYLQGTAAAYGLREDCTLAQQFVLITLASFTDGFYTVVHGDVAVVALGRWKRDLAPPSIVEFILTLVLRQAVGFAVQGFRRSRHLGTKGCLFDFTPNLSDAKFRVLQGFVCAECRSAMIAADRIGLADTLETVLRKEWLVQDRTGTTPAAMTAKLGYNLYLTKGPQPTMRERLWTTLRDDGSKELLKIIGGLLLAAILFWLGLRAGGE